MGQKTHPIGFRLGVIKTWQARWCAPRKALYTVLLHEDLSIRKSILERYPDAGVSKVEIERGANQVTATIHTARPGIVIGRGGQKVDELRHELEKSTGKRVRINIQEIRTPDLDAYLVARSIADQIQRRVAYRRAIKQAATRVLQRGALGVRIACAGRLGGAEMSRKEKERHGRVPLHTLRADIDYALAEAHTTLGRIGVKVWIYKGDILPAQQPRVAAIPAAESEPAAENPETAAIRDATAEQS
ncbi:MAG: 30S ribosomal protein S3 [Dehalococcoidia bacterium]|nr:30S ribosomal protein S3 [Dehalococcoidia bacterium]